MIKKVITLIYALALLILMIYLPSNQLASANFELYTSPPKITVSSPLTDNAYNQSSIPITVSVQTTSHYMISGEQVAWMKYSLDGAPEVSLTVKTQVNSAIFGYDNFGSGILSNLSNGAHQLYIHGITKLSDQNQTINSFNVIICFCVGTLTPTIQMQSPQTKTYDSTIVQLQFKSDKTLSWASYSLDQNIVIATQNGASITNLSNGAHTLRVYGNDSSGKICASAEVSFNINGKKPPIVTIDQAAIAKTRPFLPSDFQGKTWWKLVFHVNELTSWTGYSLDGAGATSGENDTILMTYGTHTVIAYAKDDCGNIGASDPYTFVLGPGEAGSAYGSPSTTNTPKQTQQQLPASLFLVATVLAGALVGVGSVVYGSKRKQN